MDAKDLKFKNGPKLERNKSFRKIPLQLRDKETPQLVQALEPFPKVLGPSQKHHSTRPHPLGGQGPKGTAK